MVLFSVLCFSHFLCDVLVDLENLTTVCQISTDAFCVMQIFIYCNVNTNDIQQITIRLKLTFLLMSLNPVPD